MAAELTFLFGDIEGSTRRWAAAPEEMAVALAQHDAIVREVVHDAGGEVFKHTGDGFVAVFTGAHDGVNAAIDVQRRLAATTVAVRAGLHTGPAEERDGDYFGPTLNRCARIAAAGHGGQTLVSEVTASLTRDGLRDGVTLRDLGQYQLRDLPQPDRIFQLVAPDLPVDFGPLNTAPTVAPLPVARDSFVGRDAEADALAAQITTTRLVTLTAVGGAGKTRLALEAARRATHHFADGVHLIELAAVAEPEMVVQAIADGIAMPVGGAVDVAEAIAQFVAGKRILLLLDNCEHVVEAVADIVDRLLGTSGPTVLATSREPLGVDGEHVATVRSLDADAAAQLFVDRAVAARDDFAATDDERELVAEICRRLDGIPLAIELAAARVRHLAVKDIAGHLDDRFALLTGGRRRVQNRHQTLQATMDWSYGLLTDDERALLRMLSVFTGGFDLAAVAAVNGAAPSALVGQLGSLVDKSLVHLGDTTGETVRYRLLETVRLYARERLVETGEAAAAQDAHAAWALEWTERSDELTSENATRQSGEADNIRAALEWSAEAQDVATVAQLAIAAGPMWVYLMLAGEGLRWLQGPEVDAAEAGLDLARRVGRWAITAMLHTSTMDILEAWTAAQRAIDLDPRHTAPWVWQAEFAQVQLASYVNPQGSIERLNALMVTLPERLETWRFMRGTSKLMAEHFDDATADFTAALKGADTDAFVATFGILNRSVAHHLAGRHLDAVADAERGFLRLTGVSHWLQDVCVDSALAVAHAGAGAINRAVEHALAGLERVNERYPHVYSAPGAPLAAVAVVLACAGQAEEAAALLAANKALGIWGRWEASFTLTNVYERRLALTLGRQIALPDPGQVDRGDVLQQARAALERVI